MFREQMINFLQAAVVFLLVTNALSIAGDHLRRPASEPLRWREAGAGIHRAQTERDRSTRLLMQRLRVGQPGLERPHGRLS